MSKKNKKEIILLSSTGCPPCNVAEEALKDKIASGDVRLVKAPNPEAIKLMNKADRIEVPCIFVKEGKSYKQCELFFDDKIAIAKCGEETIPIKEDE